jgi:predicted kinase
MTELVILMGLQASGKSTFYRRQLAGTHVLVSKDLLRNNRRRAHRQTRLIAEALSAGRSVAVDNTNATVELRTELIELARAHGAAVTGYYLSAKIADCLARNAERAEKDRVPEIALFATVKALVRPSLTEGFDHLFYVTIGTDGEFLVSDWKEADGG